jgi:hypothetical protein
MPMCGRTTVLETVRPRALQGIILTLEVGNVRMRVWATSLGLVLSASTAVVVMHQRQTGPNPADQGMLTHSEYARAVAIAQAEITKDQAEVTQAVAYVVSGTVKQPNLAGECTSGHVLVVSLVGHFPHIIFGSGLAGPLRQPQGPDRWVTVKADPITGQECLTGVSLGRFTAVAGAANLLPAL